MGHTSLLVHAIDNNIDNIEILLTENKLGNDGKNLVGEIINEQMNKILENAELYYLEDDSSAKRKDDVLFIEYIRYIFENILKKYNEEDTLFRFSMIYKNKKVKIEDLSRTEELLDYLFVYAKCEINGIKIDQIDDELHVKINFKKIEQHSLQSK